MIFPVEYSSLSTQALLQMLIETYSIPKHSTILFLKRGFNDTYLIESEGTRYILRVYKHRWRTEESIKGEIELLAYLKSNSISVSAAIADSRQQFIQHITAPEGIRYAVLFTYAAGEQVRKLSAEQACLLGIETAKIHMLTEGKELDTAQNYSIEYQFDTTLHTLQTILKAHPEAYAYLETLQEEFLETFRIINKEDLAKGICHGDLQAENFHLSKENVFTFFDFDFFGSAYLVYDIGVFIWYDHKNKPKEVVDAFLQGYQTKRKLTAAELKLLPYFSTLRALFQMTLYCQISDGKQLPLWPAQQVADFIKKVEKWMNTARQN
ncbi:MAG TPA: phosphotransferase [Bacteroidia bacterium]|jgi:Ser/Thr protein kinase RdoA (MazF antagonist)